MLHISKKSSLLALLLLACGPVAAQQYARPDTTVAVDSWSVGGCGVGSEHECIDEVTPDDDTTFLVSSGGDDFCDKIEFTLSSVTDPGVDTGHVWRIVARQGVTAGGSTTNWRAYLKCGSTVVKSTPIETTSSGTYSTWTYNLSTAEAANITDYSDLNFYICKLDGAGVAFRKRMRVTQVELEVPVVAVGRKDRVISIE